MCNVTLIITKALNHQAERRRMLMMNKTLRQSANHGMAQQQQADTATDDAKPVGLSSGKGADSNHQPFQQQQQQQQQQQLQQQHLQQQPNQKFINQGRDG